MREGCLIDWRGVVVDLMVTKSKRLWDLMLRSRCAWLFVVALSACSGNNGGGGYAELKALPEASLAYPDSDPLADGGYDEQMTLDGPQPASFWEIHGTQATIDEVRAYFERELLGLGWEEVPGSRTTTEIESHRWWRDDLAFTLSFKDPDEWHDRLPDSDQYPTLYEVALIARDVPTGSDSPSDAGEAP